MILYVLAAILLLLVIGFFLVRNKLVAAKNLVDSALADIDVNLVKRAQLIPQLTALAKSYAHYESQLLEDVVNQRIHQSVDSLAKADQAISSEYKQIRIVAEDYPDLKANSEFTGLMEKMRMAEDDLRFARQFYNGTVREYNKIRESFPQSIVAGTGNFPPLPLYQIAGDQKEPTNVQL